MSKLVRLCEISRHLELVSSQVARERGLNAVAQRFSCLHLSLFCTRVLGDSRVWVGVCYEKGVRSGLVLWGSVVSISYRLGCMCLVLLGCAGYTSYLPTLPPRQLVVAGRT